MAKELFQDDELPIDPEGIVEDINISEIDEQAKQEANAMCSNIKDIYFDSDYWCKHPLIKKRVDIELESLRLLIKMRRSDEISHDLCLRNLGLNGGNASLYAALAKTQSSIMSLTKQIDDTIKNINVILKGVQLELDFEKKDEQTAEDAPENKNGITRGSKKFIEQMRNEMQSSTSTQKITEQQLFEDELEDDESEDE